MLTAAGQRHTDGTRPVAVATEDRPPQVEDLVPRARFVTGVRVRKETGERIERRRTRVAPGLSRSGRPGGAGQSCSTTERNQMKKFVVAAVASVAALALVATASADVLLPANQTLQFNGAGGHLWNSAGGDSSFDSNTRALRMNVGDPSAGKYVVAYSKRSLDIAKDAATVGNLSFEFKTTSYMGAGAPRISVEFQNGDVAYLSAFYCNHPMAVTGNAWARADFTRFTRQLLLLRLGRDRGPVLRGRKQVGLARLHGRSPRPGRRAGVPRRRRGRRVSHRPPLARCRRDVHVQQPGWEAVHDGGVLLGTIGSAATPLRSASRCSGSPSGAEAV